MDEPIDFQALQAHYDDNIVPLPLWISRHQIHIPKEGDPDADTDGFGHAGLLFQGPVVEGVPVSRLSGVQFSLHPLPGDGQYEIVTAISLMPDEFLELQARRQAAAQAAQLAQMEQAFPEEDDLY